MNDEGRSARVKRAAAPRTVSQSCAVLLKFCEECFIVGEDSVLDAGVLTERLVFDAIAVD